MPLVNMADIDKEKNETDYPPLPLTDNGEE